MVQSSKKRFFRRYELHIEPVRAKGDAPNLPLFSKCEEYSLYNFFKKAIDESSQLMVENEILKIKLVGIQKNNNESFTLFFVRYNLDQTTPMVGKDEDHSLRLRSLEKEEDENIIYSVHLVIGLNVKKQIIAVLEEVDGIPMGQLTDLLNKELKRHICEYTTENKLRDRTFYSIKASGYLSERLQNSLAKGTIQGLTLIKPCKEKLSSDEEINEVFCAQELMLKVKIQKKNKDSHNLLNLAKRLLERKSDDGFEKIRFQLAFDGRKKTIAMTRTEEAKEKLYVLSTEVEFENDLPPCTTTINPVIVEKAVQQLEILDDQKNSVST